MKALNSSVTDMRKAAYMTGAGVLMAFLLFAPFFAAATTYTLSVTTDKTIYNAGATITVSGSVSPAPPSGTATTIQIKNSAGTLVDFGQASVGPSGTFTTTFVAGASYAPGSYTANAVWGLNATAPVITATANFQINGTVTSTSGGPSGTTTTVQVTTTVVEAPVTTTIVQQGATTTVVQQQQTTISSIITQAVTTTVSASATTDSTALAVGALGLIVAIVAIVLAVLFMRKK